MDGEVKFLVDMAKCYFVCVAVITVTQMLRSLVNVCFGETALLPR